MAPRASARAPAAAVTLLAATTLLMLTPILAAPPMGPYRSGAAPFRAVRSRAAAAAAASSGARAASSSSASRKNAPDPADLIAQCQLRWRNATLDHFSFAEGDGETFAQRYYVCDGHWRRPAPAPSASANGGATSTLAEPALGTAGPIFFYAGNEADVLLYLNHTGLMWENAERFGALLVFAEHRYYGRSLPPAPPPPPPPPPPRGSDAHEHGDSSSPAASAAAAAANASARRLRARLAHLSAAQAMADYAELLRELRAELGVPFDTPVAAFGGSYGGMLASWLRAHYPETIDAAVASSAPIFNFVAMDPPYPPNAFAAAVTADASPRVGGAAEGCVANVRSAWRALAYLSGHAETVDAEGEGDAAGGSADASSGDDSNNKKRQRARREAAARAMRLCDPLGDGAALLESRGGFAAARSWLSSAWDYMAMGDFPYATSYMTNGQGELPAFPVRAACEALADPALKGWEEEEEEEEEAARGAARGAERGAGDGPALTSGKELGAARLLEAMADAVGVFYNYTGAGVECYEPAGDPDPLVSASPPLSPASASAAAREGGATAAPPSSLRISRQMLAAARALLSPEDAAALERAAAAAAGARSAKKAGAREDGKSLGREDGDGDGDADPQTFGGGDDPTALDAFLWDWQYCSEMLMPFGKDGEGDFYWPEPFSLDAALGDCASRWAGLKPRVGWAVAHYGGRGLLRSTTRVTFPSGALDPWRPGSPLEVPPQAARPAGGVDGGPGPASLDAFTMPSGAHHIDTFFSDPADPPDVTAGRRRILDLLARWLDDARAERAEQRRREELPAGGGGGGGGGGEGETQQQEGVL